MIATLTRAALDAAVLAMFAAAVVVWTAASMGA
jgi:hypothetical protein